MVAIHPCYMTEQEVNHSFLAGAPMIAKTIYDMTVQHPNFLMDVLQMEEWPLGQGTTMKQLFFKGGMPEVEENLDKWKKRPNTTGCNPCVGDCGYNMTTLSGNGFDEKEIELGERQFKSPPFCVKAIETTYMYDQVFSMIVQNLYRQIGFMKEVNIAHNLLSNLSTKFVWDGGGPKFNNAVPQAYPNLGANTVLSTLNIDILEHFYEQMRYLPTCIPYAVQNSAPMFALMCSQQLLSHLYRDDPNLRQDVRFSGGANDLVMKYNFTKTIRDMFIPTSILFPRRFNRLSDGTLQRVLPYINQVPSLVGQHTAINPEYLLATYEEVLLFGKWPVKVFYMPTAQTLGENSSFGPEYAWFDAFQWINPQTVEDPLRRSGFYITTATLGYSPQFAEGLFALLVPRPNIRAAATYQVQPVCPPEVVECGNEIPSTGCPCPLILGPIIEDPARPGYYFINLISPVDVVPYQARATQDGAPAGIIYLGLRKGGYLTALVYYVSEDGKHLEVTFGPGVDVSNCDDIVSIYCDETGGCYSDVLRFSTCGLIDQVALVLRNPIKADTASDVVTIYFGDGTHVDTTVATVDILNNVWTIDLDTSLYCNAKGIVGICVPPATDATCPACGGAPTVTQCVS